MLLGDELFQPTFLHVIIGGLVVFALYQLLSAHKGHTGKGIGARLKRSVSGKSGSTPQLNTYTTDFTELARIGNIDPVIGRKKEIIRLAQVLTRRGKNNAILVGAPGVGKTAIAEGLALRIANGEVPETLKNKRVLALDVTGLLSGTKYRGEFEERAKRLVAEIGRSDRSIILFIDEVHTVIQSQGTEGSVNFSDILKPALARGELQMIGATTLVEYNKYFKSDAALERRFQPIVVEEPTKKQTLQILQGVKEKYQQHHNVVFTDAALQSAIDLTDKNIPTRTLPDKAIDAVDEAASLVRVAHISDHISLVLYSAAVKQHPILKKVWKDIQALDKKISHAKGAAQKKLIKEREVLQEKMRKKGVLSVDSTDIAAVIDEWEHTPG
jgi:ATP-dependent Clp protease ATP-binding subunit ClpC